MSCHSWRREPASQSPLMKSIYSIYCLIQFFNIVFTMRKSFVYCCNLFVMEAWFSLIATIASFILYSCFFFMKELLLSTARAIKSGMAERRILPRPLLDLHITLVPKAVSIWVRQHTSLPIISHGASACSISLFSLNGQCMVSI